MENKDYLRKQESLYWNSVFLYDSWYRKIFGGKWRLLKFGRDTPYIRLFCTWSKMPNSCWSGYFEVLETEEYKYTGVDTKMKMFKQFFKNLFKWTYLLIK